jgi:hypothetical protein
MLPYRPFSRASVCCQSKSMINVFFFAKAKGKSKGKGDVV